MSMTEVFQPVERSEPSITVPNRPGTRAVMGLDVGGTSTRAVLLTDDGTVAALATGGGANLRTSPGVAAETLTAVVTSVTQRARDNIAQPWDLSACVAGVAGGGPAAYEQVHAMLTGALAGAGLAPAIVELVPDPVVAFAAGSPAADGVVLLAGTGAAAFRVRGFNQAKRSDGLGWLLGDIGGGIWLALEGLRAAAANLDERGESTMLTQEAVAFAATMGTTSGDPRQDLVRLVHGVSPAELGAFAPTVTRLAAERDPVALRIVERAVDGLLQTYDAVAPQESDEIVLAGSILTTPGPIRDGVAARLGRRTHDAVQPVVGALRLAAHRAGWPLPRLDVLSAALDKAPNVRVDTGTRPALAIDHYRSEDRATLYDICLRTGASGADASKDYQDGDLLGHVYLGAYLEFEPDLARILRRADGTAIGYCVAARDTTAFEARCEAQWWPALRDRYALEADEVSADARMIRMIHSQNRTQRDFLAKFPSHLHIDLLPEAQGGGNGKRLLEAVLEALAATGSPGVHLGVGASNVRAIGFYERNGFRTLEHLQWGLIMGRRL